MPDLQSLCELGQERLVATDYLGAERALREAEQIAWEARDWDTLGRLYMPLQEARRQRRQRCGEGIVKLDILATDDGAPDAEHIVAAYPHGQLLVADVASIETAIDVRTLAEERNLYLDTFLAATYTVDAATVVAIVPTANVQLPPNDGRPLDKLLATLPPFSMVMTAADIRHGERRGNDTTYAQTMRIWETLHSPFLSAALTATDPVRKMAALREVIAIDYAAEIPHQHLANTARQLLKKA